MERACPLTITVLSQKGGTGKTTTVRTLADAYRRSGLEVLCVDLDPQGNLSDYFDVPADASPTIADVLAGQARAADAVYDDILPANLGLAEAELVLGGKMGRELTLKRGLREIKRGYDLVLVDCPPSLGLLTVNALVAADHALITSEAEYFSLQGVEQALEVVELARESLHPDLDWLGVVLNIADMRLVHSREALKSLRERFADKVFATVIRRASATRSRPSAACRSSTSRPGLGADYWRWPPRYSRGWAGSRRAARGASASPSSSPTGFPRVRAWMFTPGGRAGAHWSADRRDQRRGHLVEASLERIEELSAPAQRILFHVDAEGALATADAIGPGRPAALCRGADRHQGHTAPVAGHALHDGLRPVRGLRSRGPLRRCLRGPAACGRPAS